MLSYLDKNIHNDVVKYYILPHFHKLDLDECPLDYEILIGHPKMNIVWASKNGHLDVVMYLVSLGADVRDYDKAVIWASQNGHLDVIMYLVSLGANVRADDDFAIRAASQNGHLDVIMYLVSQGANVRGFKDRAVVLASKNGHLEVVEYLVSQGIDIHVDYERPVKEASEKGYLEIVKYLVEHGANVDVCGALAIFNSSLQQVPDCVFCVALTQGHPDIYRYLLQQSSHERCKYNHFKKIEKLIKQSRN